MPTDPTPDTPLTKRDMADIVERESAWLGAKVDATARTAAESIENLAVMIRQMHAKMFPEEDPTDPYKIQVGAGVDTVSSWIGNFSNLQQRVGNLQAARHFDPGWATTVTSGPARLSIGTGRTIFLSTKQISQAPESLERYYRSGVGLEETIFHSAYHEPEDNIERGEFTREQWLAAQIANGTAIKNIGDPKIKFSIILQLWSESDRPEFMEWLTAQTALWELVDAVGLDVYQRNDTPYKKATFRPWSYNGDLIKAIQDRYGKAIFLGEVGCGEKADDPEYRPDWISDMGDQALQDEWLAILWYNAWKPATPTSNHASTDPSFCFDTAECSVASLEEFRELVIYGGD